MPYAWDCLCPRCVTFLCRIEYWQPRTDGNEWVALAMFRRLTLPPEVSNPLGLDASTGWPRYGLRRRAERRLGSASRSGRTSGWRTVKSAAHVRCPFGCGHEFLIKPMIVYGMPPDPREPWPWWVDPVSGNGLEDADPDSLWALVGRRIGPRGRPGLDTGKLLR
jgi:hypothetical protein